MRISSPPLSYYYYYHYAHVDEMRELRRTNGEASERVRESSLKPKEPVQ